MLYPDSHVRTGGDDCSTYQHPPQFTFLPLLFIDSYSNMALCFRCAHIDLEDGTFYALPGVGIATKSAARGCSGCKFFLEVMRSAESETVDENTQMLLQRLPEQQNRVDLNFMNRAFGAWGFVGLRLCSAYGNIWSAAKQSMDADECRR
jgi:hypothetical protein